MPNSQSFGGSFKAGPGKEGVVLTAIEWDPRRQEKELGALPTMPPDVEGRSCSKGCEPWVRVIYRARAAQRTRSYDTGTSNRLE